MNKQETKIHIIGAGISGLIAATVLEKHGFSPVIIEATDRPGGRIKTDLVEGYALDHGFQVLLTAYPAAQKYLDYDSLDLQPFVPGAAIFKNGAQKIIGDPSRDISLLFSTLTSGIGTFSDKFKILKLNNRLKKKSLEKIFSEPEHSTLNYLEGLGFSEEMIEDFFRPFFSGIFLENKLETSSRMFEFVYKMFGAGYATLPKNGIEAIPQQLVESLKNTTFKFHEKVSEVREGEIILNEGKKIESDFTIIATEANNLISNLKNQGIEWNSCDTLYFETRDRIIKKPIIGLIPSKDTIINNIFYPTSQIDNTKSNKELLSVTVVDNQGLTNRELIQRVEKELLEHCGIQTVTFIKQYFIPLSLPKLDTLHYEMSPSETRLSASIFLAGDIQLNGSLNAAMISGERAALGVLESL